MLARLMRIPGLTDARVECSGTFLALSLREDALGETALAAALQVLGPGARPLLAADASAQLERRGRGEIWFSAQEIRGLSYLEGRVLAARAFAAATGGAALERGAADQVGAAILAEILATLDRVHDEGGRDSSGWFYAEWPELVTRVGRRLESTLTPPVLAEVVERLRREHGSGAACSAS